MRNRKIKITLQSFLNENIDNKKDDVKYLRINLLDEYKKTGEDKEYEEKFNEFKNKVKGFTNTNNELNLKTGDIVSYISGYNDDIIYTSKILGFDSDGKAFILKDSYWFAIDLSKTMVETENINEGIKDTILTGAMCVMLASGLVSCSKVDNPVADRITYKPAILTKLNKEAFNNLNAESDRKNSYIWYTNVYGTTDKNGKDIEKRHAMYDYTSKNISYGTKKYNEYPGDSVKGASTGLTPCEVIDIAFTKNTSYKLNSEDIKNYKYIVLIKVHNATDIDFSDNNKPKEFSVDGFTGFIVYLTNINKINIGDLYPTYPQNLIKDVNKIKKIKESSNIINIKP